MACTFNAITYGGISFTGFPVSTMNSEAIKDDGGNTVKYIRNTLEVEFIISMETCKIDTGIAVGSIDADMDYIRQVLQSPNRSFSFAYRGAGRGNVDGEYDSEFVVDLKPDPTNALTRAGETLNSMGMGIQPEILTWEPLAGSKAARVRCRCVFYTSKRAIPSLSFTTVKEDLRAYDSPYEYTSHVAATRTGYIRQPANPALITTGYDGGATVPFDWKVLILSFTEEQEVDIDQEGFLTLTLKGVIEFSGEAVRTVNTDWAQPQQTNPREAFAEEFLNEPRNRRAIAQDLARYFEPYRPLGFSRKHRFVYDKTQRKLEYVIVDTEQVNPKGKFPRIINWEATHKVASTLGSSESVFQPQGFYTWENVFTGTFTVAPGYWKGWAWVAMLVLVKQRIERTVPMLGDDVQEMKDDIDSSTNVATQNANVKDRKKFVPKHILTDVTVLDYLHNNRVDMTLRYIVMTSLGKLFSNTGLFSRVVSLFSSDTSATPNKDGVKTNPLADGVTPSGNAREWQGQTAIQILEANKFYDKLSSNAVGYSGLGLSNYNVIFDPDSLNLVSNSTLKDENGGAMPTWTGPPSHSNTQQSDVYGWYRRNKQYVEHPLNNFQEDIPASPPQPVEEAAGTPTNTTGTANPYPGSESIQSSWMKNLDPAQSWLGYSPNFRLVEMSNSSYVPTIQAAPIAAVKGDYNHNNTAEYMTRGVTGLTINNRNSAYGYTDGQPNNTRYEDHAVISHGKPTYYIRFTGSATRVGYPIPMPVIHGLQNQSSPGTVLSVYRIGKQYWDHRQVANSADMPIFEAEWDITYAIQGDPTCNNIAFIHSRPSEFA